MNPDGQQRYSDGDIQPKKPPKTWLWVLVVVGGLLMTCCCGGIGTIGGVMWYFGKQAGQASDRVFQEALAGGDLGAAYERAIPEFKEKYSKEQLVKLGKDIPELLKRDNWTTIGFVVNAGDGGNVLVRFILNRAGTASELKAYCREDTTGKLQLLGISPDLDAAVPDSLKKSLANAGSGQWHD